MTRARAFALVAGIVLGALAPRVASADPERDADIAFRAAQARATAGDPGALDALEAIGGAQPATRWTDDAWSAAAHLAERAGDLARARADYARAVATAGDDIARHRAEAAIARLSATGGAHGEWDAVVARGNALGAEIASGAGDPKPAIAELDALVRANPAFPGATDARLVIAHGWQRDGERARGIAVLDEAIAAAPTPALANRARYAAIHARLAAGELDAARAELDLVARTAEPMIVVQLTRELAAAELHARVRLALGCVVAIVAALALGLARRDAGSWRAAARRLVPPPTEVWYLGPVLAVLALVATRGNPLIAQALRAIALAGISIAWLSGASLELARAAGRLSTRRMLAHVVAVLAVGLGVTFLVIDHDRMIDLLLETWRSGPALP